MNIRPLLIPLIVAGCLTTLRAQDAPTTWTSSQGKAIEAEFVRLDDDGVVLKLKSDGRQATVPFKSLSLESHLQAIKLAKPEAFSKPLVKAEVEPAIVLPPPKEVDLDSVMQSPFSASQSLQEFVDTARSELLDGNYFVAWHALPSKMQDDAETLIVKGMAKVGKAPLVQIKTMLRDINIILTDKQEFLLNNKTLIPSKQVEKDIKLQLPFLSQFAGSVANEELWQEENFQPANVERWLGQFVSAIGSNHAAGIALANAQTNGMAESMIPELLKVVSSQGKQGQVEIAIPGVPPNKYVMRQVGEIWLAPQLMTQVRQGLDAALANIDSVDETGLRTGIQTALGTVIPAFGSLARAETQEEFDAVIASIEPLLKGLTANMPAGMAGGPPPGGPGAGGLGAGRGNPPPGGGNTGFGSGPGNAQ